MNELHVAHFVRQHLNRGTQSVKPVVAERLSKARRAALERQKRPVRNAVLAGIGAHFNFDDITRHAVSAVAALLLLMASFSYWHGQQLIADMEEVDSAILTDDLPLGALVDKGFDSWLQSSAEQ